MKKLFIFTIVLFLFSCSKNEIDDAFDPNDVIMPQNHYKVNYRTVCDGEAVGFYHVSIEEWSNREFFFHTLTCWSYRLVDMSGETRFFVYHSFEYPCTEH